MFEHDPEESRQLTARIAVAPELSPKVASQKGAHAQNQMPGCAGASALAADEGRELQGMRGRLGSRSWEIWSPDGGQLDAERLTASPWSWSKQSPEASKSCLVLLPSDSVLVDIH